MAKPAPRRDSSMEVIAPDEARHQALAFGPWDGVGAHRPLGSITRSREPAHEMSPGFRAEANDCPIRHPRGAADPG